MIAIWLDAGLRRLVLSMQDADHSSRPPIAGRAGETHVRYQRYPAAELFLPFPRSAPALSELGQHRRPCPDPAARWARACPGVGSAGAAAVQIGRAHV